MNDANTIKWTVGKQLKKTIKFGFVGKTRTQFKYLYLRV